MPDDDPALFDIEPTHPPANGVALTPGERMRLKQAERIRAGWHPLSYSGATILLHPDAGRPTSREEAIPGAPTCGTCTFRVLAGGHARSFPKCIYGRTVREIPPEEQRKHGPKRVITTPRATNGLASDVRAWWPACSAWKPADDE